MAQMLSPVLVTPPAALPVDLADVKAHLRIDTAEEDQLIDTYLTAAVARLDGWKGVLGRCLVTQTWRQSFSEWPASGILRLPLAPVASITSVKYSDAGNVEQTVSNSNYTLSTDTLGPYVRLASTYGLPELYAERDDVVRVEYVAGYGAASAVPRDIKTAILFHCQALYERESETRDRLMGAHDALVSPYVRAVLT